MEIELKYLYCSLVFSFILAPLLTNNFFLNNSKIYKCSHIIALIFVLASIIFGIGLLTVVWPAFNLFGLFIHFKNKRKNLFKITTLATFIPLAFSIIASIWLVAGSNDLYLLGYDINWSFYAALHGNYLGWIFLGCMGFLSTRNIKFSNFYSIGCFISFVLFLSIAFGIDGVPYIKAVGVIGLTLLVPLTIGLFSFTTRCKISKYLSMVSLILVLLSMTLAVLNEFWTVEPQYFLGARSMVTIHGVLNAFLVTPIFFLAIKLDETLTEKTL